jgi:capsular exopolysaccharide synthesis family protein
MNDWAFLQDVRQYVAAVHRRRGVLLTCLGLSLLGALVYNFATRPLYQATAQILIEREVPNVLLTKEVVDLGQGGADYYMTQYQLLQGRVLASRVVERLELHKSPEFQIGAVLSPWERLQRLLGRSPTLVDKDGMPLSPAVAAFRSRLTVEPVVGSRLVNLRFAAYDPALAAQAANTLAQVYIEQDREFRFTTSSEATGWLSQRLKEQQARVEEAERKLQEYREREGLVNLEERRTLADERLRSFAAAASEARTARIGKQTVHEQMQATPAAELGSAPLVLSNPVVQGLRTRLAQLQAERARLSDTLGEKHPDMVRIASEIGSAEGKVEAEIQDILRSVENDYRTAVQQEQSLVANLEAAKNDVLEINRKAIEYGVLKREMESNQQIFESLLNRTKETGLQTELKSTNIRVVEKAEVPQAPISPRRGRNLQIALLAGLVLGVGLCLLFEHFDSTLKTPEDVKEHLGQPFLGMVPDVGPEGTGDASRRGPVFVKEPQSKVAEAYRVLRTNLLFSSADTTGRALLVSSAHPGEGKTTTAANLGAALAHNGARVLVVDADLRRPTLHQHFGIPSTPGLSDVIVGKCEIADAIQSSGFKGLRVLTCGYIPPDPAELLGSARMKEVVRSLRGLYDWVLIDTPPLLAMADSPVLCAQADGVVLVVGAEISGRPAILRAIEQIKGVGGRVTGVVLNKVDLERNSFYYGQYYGEYYRNYYSDAEGAAAGPRPVRRR